MYVTTLGPYSDGALTVAKRLNKCDLESGVIMHNGCQTTKHKWAYIDF
jgi:hypothetical protein